MLVGWLVGWMDGVTDRRMEGWMADKQTGKQTLDIDQGPSILTRRMDKWMDRWTNG